ncbi:MAG: hypothetical protein HC895_23665 [Leptolyngbyaceae cyanobacterium SM1_3_5]|nr:hypothetical protein [Leptolyngbyaceae cyanobacterium SM1_3_5]
MSADMLSTQALEQEGVLIMPAQLMGGKSEHFRVGFGRENFVGTLFANNQLQLFGTEIVPPASGIVTGVYNADVTPDGKRIVNGSWGGVGIPGTWTAVQVVP